MLSLMFRVLTSNWAYHHARNYASITVAISALVLAQKVWDDTPLINADFSILYPALTVKEINFLERKFLDLLEFKVIQLAQSVPFPLYDDMIWYE
jgi:hypothetical protein